MSQQVYNSELRDLVHLRSMNDRLVSEAVSRKEWDLASETAVRSREIDQAIHHMMLAPQQAAAATQPAGSK